MTHPEKYMKIGKSRAQTCLKVPDPDRPRPTRFLTGLPKPRPRPPKIPIQNLLKTYPKGVFLVGVGVEKVFWNYYFVGVTRLPKTPTFGPKPTPSAFFARVKKFCRGGVFLSQHQPRQSHVKTPTNFSSFLYFFLTKVGYSGSGSKKVFMAFSPHPE